MTIDCLFSLHTLYPYIFIFLGVSKVLFLTHERRLHILHRIELNCFICLHVRLTILPTCALCFVKCISHVM